jgi:carboxypeptidase Taq
VFRDELNSLRAQLRELRHLDAVIGLLSWDEETYLPDGARRERGAQLATLEGLRHRLLCADALGDLADRVAAATAADSLVTGEIERLRRLRRIALALPDDLVRAFAEARSRSLAAWERARHDDDFDVFAPALADLLRLVRERAQALSRCDEHYDGLLDEYEPGMTRARLEPVLDSVGDRLAPLVAELAERTQAAAEPLPVARYGEAAQAALCRQVLTDMGFDFTRGRLDRSTHPFTLMAGGNDIRLTIRVFEDNPLSALFASLHEGGHGLYDQGFAPELDGTLLADAPGMGIHESQSRFWENHIGRRESFWVHRLPLFQAAFPGVLDGWTPPRFVRAINVVRPGVNRVEADEATYNLHILLRYRLELALVDGDLSVAELPAAWNELSVRLLGVRPASAREGCLQDVHWALGAVGYFPSYLIGNLYAAQLLESHVDGHDLDDALARGDLAPTTAWLRHHVHSHGHRFSADEIVTRATGRGLDPDPFFRTLLQRFDALR